MTETFCPICGRSCRHGWHCAWCGKALSSVLHPDGYMKWHNAESGVRHFEECEQWQRATQTSGAIPAHFQTALER